MAEQLFQEQAPEGHLFGNPALCPDLGPSVSPVGLPGHKPKSEVTSQRNLYLCVLLHLKGF